MYEEKVIGDDEQRDRTLRAKRDGWLCADPLKNFYTSTLICLADYIMSWLYNKHKLTPTYLFKHFHETFLSSLSSSLPLDCWGRVES